MRTKEQFKAYVYEKAEAEMQRKKRSRNVWIRSIATCSLLLVIGCVALYSGLGGMISEVAQDSTVDMKGNFAEVYRYSPECETENYVVNDSIEYSAALGETVLDGAEVQCAPTAESYGSVIESFNYYSSKLCADDAGVKDYGFNNTEKIPENEFDALELAKNECTVEYDSYTVAYDADNKIWRVVFYMSDTVGGDQTVYIGSDGITKLIVYGE